MSGRPFVTSPAPGAGQFTGRTPAQKRGHASEGVVVRKLCNTWRLNMPPDAAPPLGLAVHPGPEFRLHLEGRRAESEACARLTRLSTSIQRGAPAPTERLALGVSNRPAPWKDAPLGLPNA